MKIDIRESLAIGFAAAIALATVQVADAASSHAVHRHVSVHHNHYPRGVGYAVSPDAWSNGPSYDGPVIYGNRPGASSLDPCGDVCLEGG